MTRNFRTGWSGFVKASLGLAFLLGASMGFVALSATDASAQRRGNSYGNQQQFTPPGNRGRVSVNRRRGGGPVPVRRRGYNRGAAAAAGIAGALAIGAIAAQAAEANRRRGYIEDDGPDCYTQNRRVWSERRGAYLVRRVEVCE